MTDRTRPAAATRILAAGLSTATTLALTGLMAVEARSDEAATADVVESAVPPTDVTPVQVSTSGPAAEPRRVVVRVHRVHEVPAAQGPATRASAPSVPAAPAPAPAPPAPAAPAPAAPTVAPAPAPAPAPAAPAPRSTSRGS